MLRTSDHLELSGGAEVYHAEDLRPALLPDSSAAREAERADSRQSSADLLTAAGIVLLTVGASVAVAPFLVTESDDESINIRPIYIGTGLAVLSIPAFLMSGERRRAAKDSKANAFELYEHGLRQRLDVCLRSDAVEPCPAKGAAPSGAERP